MGEGLPTRDALYLGVFANVFKGSLCRECVSYLCLELS